MATLQQMFSNRRLLILGISESVSNTGSWITMMAVYAMLVFRGGGDIISSSAVYLVGLVPTLLFSPVAGWLCDRLDRKVLMIASELVSGLVISGLIFVRQPVWIYTLLGIQAISVSIMAPARQAVVPAIVPASELTRANAFLQQLNGIIKIAAPALAGLVLALLDPHQAILLDVVSFALSALILTRLPSLPPQAVRAAAGKSAPAAAQGVWPALREIEGLRMLFIAVFLAITVIIGFDVLAPVYTRDTLRGGESLFGLMISLVGVGTLGASLALMLRRSPAAPWRDLTLGLFLLAMIPAVMFGAAFGDPSQARVVILIGALVGGVGNGLLSIQAGTLLQTLSPASLLGRMSGLFQSVGVTGQLVGILVTPLVVPALLPITAYLAVMAAALLIVTALLAGYTLRGRKHLNKMDLERVRE
jgi:MFS family permease